MSGLLESGTVFGEVVGHRRRMCGMPQHRAGRFFEAYERIAGLRAYRRVGEGHIIDNRIINLCGGRRGADNGTYRKQEMSNCLHAFFH